MGLNLIRATTGGIRLTLILLKVSRVKYFWLCCFMSFSMWKLHIMDMAEKVATQGLGCKLLD